MQYAVANTIKINKSNLFIFILIIMQPVIDLATSLSGEQALSIGAVLKAVMMAGLFWYIAHDLLTNNTKWLWPFIGAYAAVFIMAVVSLTLKNNMSLFAEANFILKSCYYLVMIFTALILGENKKVSRHLLYRAISVNSIIIGVSYWLAIGTKTSKESYAYTGLGSAGWFHAANELSVIVFILLGLTIVQLRSSKLAWAGFLFMLSMLPMIGTKTAFFGGMLLIGLYITCLFIQSRLRIWTQQRNLLFLSVMLLFLCLLPLTPITGNSMQTDAETAHEQIQEQHSSPSPAFLQKILSSRDIYFHEIKTDYMEAHGLRKAFGLGYAGDYGEKEAKMIEMDFFDLFFSYGVIGAILMLLPLIYLCRKVIRFPVNLTKRILYATLGLCFSVAFLAGHVLFAPSVMTYVALTLIILGLENDRVDN